MSRERDCVADVTRGSAAGALAGYTLGFIQAHEAFKRLTLQEKLQRAQNLQRTARVIGVPVMTATAMGAAFTGVRCYSQNYRQREDAANGMLGSVTAGCVYGLVRGRVGSAIGASFAIMGMSLLADFFQYIAHPALDGVVPHGKPTHTHFPGEMQA